MIDEKKLREAERRVKQYISEGIIRSREKPEYVDFFIRNSEDSIDSAKALFDLSTIPEKRELLGFADFNLSLTSRNISTR